MDFVVLIKKNVMEIKKKICILYPIGNYMFPTTGGEVYDSYLFKKIASSLKVEVSYFTDTDTGSVNKWYLPVRIWQHREKIISCHAIFLNSGWVAQSLWIILLFRLFYSHLDIYIIHHHFRYQGMRGVKSFLFSILERIGLILSSAVITPNPYTRTIIRRIVPHCQVIFLEMAFRKEKRPCSCHEKIRLLYVGTVYKRKGVFYLIKALGMMNKQERKNIHLDVVGNISSKNYYNKLRILVSKNGLEDVVSFSGRVSDEELRNYYSKAYCFVFPSLLEGYGMVLIEAMSYGLPVIAFNNSAIPFTLKDGKNGILVENKNVKALKNAILALCNDVNFHSNLSKGALVTYNNVRSLFDLDNDIEKFITERLLK